MSWLATLSKCQQLHRGMTVDPGGGGGFLRITLGLGHTRPVGIGQSILVEYLVDCADIAAPVKVYRGIGELDHCVGCEGINTRY